MKIDVMGVQFDNVTMAEAIERAAALLQTPEADYCVTPNAEIVYEAMRDAAFAKLLNEASLVLPDGAGVVLGSRILGNPRKGKVAGIEFADALAAYLAKNRYCGVGSGKTQRKASGAYRLRYGGRLFQG